MFKRLLFASVSIMMPHKSMDIKIFGEISPSTVTLDTGLSMINGLWPWVPFKCRLHMLCKNKV